MKIEIVGVHPVRAVEPCHLIELWVRQLNGDMPMDGFTQEVAGQPHENWQVPYDERVLSLDGTTALDDPFPEPITADGTDVRLAFFFHYLDLRKPLLTPIGPLTLPAETKRPNRLKFIKYEPP
jgi:hypothetical protein